MVLKTLHKQLISKLKTALHEVRDCFVFYKNITRRTVELNYIPVKRDQPGLRRWSTPVDDVLPILRENDYIKINNPSQVRGIIPDPFRDTVPPLRPDCQQYSKHYNLVKSDNLTISPNETREVVDVIADKTLGNHPSVFTIRARKSARVTYVLAVFGDGEITKDVTLELEEGAEGRIVGLVIASGKARFTLKTTLRHRAPRTKGDIKIKMVLKDTAYVSYDGLIKIDKPAQQTNSYLDARALILDRGAKCDGKPELEIEADDVKASHAFSSGKIDSEQLFYLRSRGLSEEEAKRMIVQGFLMGVLEGLSHETQDRIKREVAIVI